MVAAAAVAAEQEGLKTEALGPAVKLLRHVPVPALFLDVRFAVLVDVNAQPARGVVGGGGVEADEVEDLRPLVVKCQDRLVEYALACPGIPLGAPVERQVLAP